MQAQMQSFFKPTIGLHGGPLLGLGTGPVAEYVV
jgi:hypothetical protein